ncbi:ATP-dependent DNA helicase [Trichonephila inaurata madagascariensis]|uniref:ATP-dependent DNA helicase n=1 Tax=Trichonephila inaurata madagascariensis TaxID=2747483 RepID=A0A8X7CD18_9ARAC|nr:ATP-dependent DNA helicase [Trichonephila inaurata madagascariensis]
MHMKQKLLMKKEQDSKQIRSATVLREQLDWTLCCIQEVAHKCHFKGFRTHRSYDPLQYPLLFVKRRGGSSAIMVGATVVLAGDFRQTLPIVTHGTPAHQINACLKNSYLWHQVEKFSRTTNIRSHIQEAASRQEYAYKSIDCILNDDEAIQYPIEFLNSIQTPDLQAHNLILKVGAPIMLIRNIDAPRLCNGTRLIVKKLMQHVIQATVLLDVFIPRIPIIPSDNTIQFKRIEFTLKLCFAMTINKSQDQSLGIAGIDLQTPCFSHGRMWPIPEWAKRKIFLYTLKMELSKILSITLL